MQFGPFSVEYKNRQDFSHCPANVKSRLDEVLRRGSVSVKTDFERWLLEYVANVCLSGDFDGRARSSARSRVLMNGKTRLQWGTTRLRSTQR